MKSVRRRPAAADDMHHHVAYRAARAGEASANALVDGMRDCLHSISESPASGSRRIGQLLGIPDLRWKRVGRTRLWFWYAEADSHIDVIRLISTDQSPRLAMVPDDLR